MSKKILSLYINFTKSFAWKEIWEWPYDYTSPLSRTIIFSALQFEFEKCCYIGIRRIEVCSVHRCLLGTQICENPLRKSRFPRRLEEKSGTSRDHPRLFIYLLSFSSTHNSMWVMDRGETPYRLHLICPIWNEGLRNVRKGWNVKEVSLNRPAPCRNASIGRGLN